MTTLKLTRGERCILSLFLFTVCLKRAHDSNESDLNMYRNVRMCCIFGNNHSGSKTAFKI